MHLDISLGQFYGLDSIIDLLILLVAVLISYQSYHIYKLMKEKNYRYFSWAFASIAAAFFFKILSNITTAYRVVIEKTNFILIVTHELQEMQILNLISFISYKFFLLVGFMMLFLTIKKDHKKEDAFLFAYFLIITVFFSIYFNFIFHFTLLLILTILTIYFYKNNKRVNSKNSYLVFAAFVFILVSQGIDIFYSYHPLIYLTGEILMFIGFLILLLNHTGIKNGEKKNKAGSNQRPLRSS